MIVPEGFATANIYLAVEDIVKYANFIIEAFGGKEVGRSHRQDGNIANCQIRINTNIIMISSAGGFLKPSKSYIIFLSKMPRIQLTPLLRLVRNW